MSCAIGAVGGAAGDTAGAPNVGGGACVAVFPVSGPESSEEQEGWQEYAEEVALAEEELALLAFPSHRSANTAHRKPAGVPVGTAIAVAELRAGDEFKRSGQLLDEAVGASGAIKGACGAVGGATGGAVGAANGAAARVGGGAGVAGSGGWTRASMAVVVGAGGRHSAEAGAQA